MRRSLVVLIALFAALIQPAEAGVHKGLEVLPSPRPLAPLAIVDGEGHGAGLDTLRGKPVLLNLWASWCLPCMAELPALDHLAASGGKVAVVALSLDRGGANSVAAAYARLGITHLPVRVDVERKAGEVWQAPVLPITLLVDAQGREVARFVGAAHWDQPEAQPLLSALAAGAPLSPAMAPPPATFSGPPP